MGKFLYIAGNVRELWLHRSHLPHAAFQVEGLWIQHEMSQGEDERARRVGFERKLLIFS